MSSLVMEENSIMSNLSFQIVQGSYLLDGVGGEPVKDGQILIENGKIRAVGRHEDISVPEGVQIKKHIFPGCTIMPGLIDTHTHLNYPGDGTHTNDVMNDSDDILLMRSIQNAQNYLKLGVTTIRDNGAKNNTTLSLKEGITRGLATGPRLVICANPLTITGGHMWQMGGEADGVYESIKGVRQLVKRGADYIKVTATGGTTYRTYPNSPSYNLDELQAIVHESHKFKKLVATHCHATEGIINSLDAGADMIIHCTWREPDGSSQYREDVVNRIVENGTWINPTLDQHIGAPRETLLNKLATDGLTSMEQARLDAIEQVYPERIKQIEKMIMAGVKFVTGTDSGFGEVSFNRISKEMALFVEAGMGRMEAILTATRYAAEALGLSELVGTLEPGKEADIAVFKGEPHRNIDNINKVVAVFHAGERIV